MFTYFLLSVISYLLYKLDFYNIAHETYKVKKRKLTRLKNLVSTQYSGVSKITWICICMLVKALYLMLIQWLYQTVRHIGPNLYEISYVGIDLPVSFDANALSIVFTSLSSS